VIGFLRGIIISKTPPFLLLDVQGVGYEIEAPMTTFYDLPELNEQVSLHTHLVVRDDAHILFGFSAETDRAMFRHLIKVNGVGPKLALILLSGLTADEFRRCIEDSDAPALIRLPGVGKKTAERLIIEMRDRLPPADDNQTRSSKTQTKRHPQQEAIGALVTLGYKANDASKMVKAVTGDNHSSEQLIRLALQGALR